MASTLFKVKVEEEVKYTVDTKIELPNTNAEEVELDLKLTNTDFHKSMDVMKHGEYEDKVDYLENEFFKFPKTFKLHKSVDIFDLYVLTCEKVGEKVKAKKPSNRR